MKKRTIVISLGGSIIIPDKINFTFLHQFKKTLKELYPKYKLVVVCGGGSIARKYIAGLREEGIKSNYQLSQAGIRATRENAMFMMQFFGKQANDSLPLDMKQVKSNLNKNSVVFCGGLRYADNSTSDETSAKLAKYLNSTFINMTNVAGLYTSDPRTNKKAKLIKKISWKDFEAKALKLKYKPGQHFVLDQKASTLIKQHKIPTYILGPDLSQLKNVLNNKKFEGTLIEG